METINTFTLENYLLIIAGLINILIVFFILLRSSRTSSTLSFSGIILSLTVWIFSNYLIDQSRFIAEGVVWTKVSGIGIILFVIFFSIFSYNFPLVLKKYKLIISILSIIGLFQLLIISFSNSIVRTVDITVFPVKVIYGDLYPFLISWMLISFTLNIFLLIRKYSILKGLYKTQLKLILYSFSFVIFVSLVTNLLLPILGVSELTRVGPISTIMLCGFILFMITKLRLFDIRILFGKVLYFIFLGLLTIIFYYLIYSLNNLLFGTSHDFRALILGIPISLAFIIFFNSANKFILEKIDSTLISPDYDPSQVIAEYNNEIGTVLDYTDIANYIISTFAKTIRSSYEGVILLSEKNEFELIESKKNLEVDKEFVETISELWKKHGREIINLDLLELEIPARYVDDRNMINDIINYMKTKELKLIVPIGSSNNILGMIMLGKKDGDTPYNSVELNFISSIADISSLALARSLLYREVQEFNDTLQIKIKEATQEIQEKNAKLEEALRIERDMLDVLGHELRTPLGTARNAILVVESLMEKEGGQNPELAKYLTVAVENIRREVQLLETILASTKIDNNKLDLKLEEVNVEEVINDSIQAYQLDAEKKKLKLVKNSIDKQMSIKADRLRIQQILDNVVSNAVKYTNEGSVTLKAEEEGNRVKISVIDTGEGIPENEIAKLGKKFYRVNNYLSSNGKLGERQIVRPGGTGIGLYVVTQLIKAMGGELKIESTLGKGSTFTIYLPKN